MNINDFHSEIQKLLPVKRNTKDFRIDLSSVLTKYLQMIKSLDADIVLSIENWSDTFERIDKLIGGIKDAVKHYYEGAHGSAFNVLKNQMIGYGKTIKGVIDIIELYSVNQGDCFYRGRLFENNRHKSYKDMFHIPLDKRGIIKTQRYSTPGYPCLYLGSTIFACWEELGQPKFDDLMISAFQATRDFKLFDLRTPKKEEFYSEKLDKLLLRLPLILACSFVIKDDDKSADFKPEYIIPQLLIEVIINKNRGKHKKRDVTSFVLGVIFTSTHTNEDFLFPTRVFDNIAIPALDVSSSKGYCNILSECFKLTDPKCYEYEELKEDFGINMRKFGLEPKAELEQNYELSKMGKLERRVNGYEFYQFNYIVVSPVEITLSAEGTPVKVSVRSNIDWKIE
ncbi:MAG: hypothetical protein WCZ43_05515 [Proteiniphilum sp.]